MEQDSQYQVYVSNIPYHANSSDLEDALKIFGEIVDARIIYTQNKYGKRISRGFGFVTFRDQRSFNRATNPSNLVRMSGRILNISQAHKKPTKNFNQYGYGFDREDFDMNMEDLFAHLFGFSRSQPKGEEVFEDINLYYSILEIDRNADQDAIKQAYRTQARKWHPDKNQDKKEIAHETFQKIQEAYDVLRDPQKREEYDNKCKKIYYPM